MSRGRKRLPKAGETDSMKKGEIWIVDLADGKGHEQKGERPALVLATYNDLTIVAPLTSSEECARFAFTLPIEKNKVNGLSYDSVALLFQITALDDSRFIEQTGRILKEKKDAIDKLLLGLFKINIGKEEEGAP